MIVKHAGVPIRDLFALSDGEVRQLQLEARNKRALDAAKKLELVERSKPKPPPGPPPPTKKPPPPPGPPPGVYPFAPRPPEIPAGLGSWRRRAAAFGGVEEAKGGSASQQPRARLQSPRRGPRGPPPRGPPPPERGARGPQRFLWESPVVVALFWSRRAAPGGPVVGGGFLGSRELGWLSWALVKFWRLSPRRACGARLDDRS